ncbi:MAG TPA: CaiB/BaiF CoA-transferase family protein [Dehalococcoidia bacterium]|nr:CaiB/BaiF CoA-transferase family protein [Dehalococcoidia bacterium]
MGPLTGIKVLDFTRAVAGGFTTRLLCDMGARVIKIEAPEVGERIRYAGTDDVRVGRAMVPQMSPMFIHSNAGKESICVDMARPGAVELLKRLVAQVDVVVENFTPHVMRKYGLTYNDLKAVRPDLVMCSITGFGQEGPLADHVAVDASIQAISGMAFLAGEADGYPVLAGNGIADTLSAVMAALAIVSALYHRALTGQGQYIDLSMMQAVLSVDCNATPIYAATRGDYHAQRDIRSHFLLVPWGVFKGPKGRYFAMLADWTRLCQVMGRPELIEDPRFATNEARIKNKDLVHDIIEEFLQGFEDDEAAFQALIEGKVPAAPVLSPWEAIQHPQMQGRGAVRDVPYPGGVTIPTVATPLHFSATPIKVGRAPFVGEHNEKVLTELLGLPQDQIAALYDQGVLFRDPSVQAWLEAESGD